MRWLSLIVAFVLLLVALVGFMGGVGPLIAIGEYSDAFGLPNVAVWALQLGYIAIFFGGIVCCIVSFGGLRRAVGSALDRASSLGDWSVFTGHCALLAAIANIVLWDLHLWHWDLVYLLFMVAAALYSFGLGALAVRFRAPRASTPPFAPTNHAP